MCRSLRERRRELQPRAADSRSVVLGVCWSECVRCRHDGDVLQFDRLSLVQSSSQVKVHTYHIITERRDMPPQSIMKVSIHTYTHCHQVLAQNILWNAYPRPPKDPWGSICATSITILIYRLFQGRMGAVAAVCSGSPVLWVARQKHIREGPMYGVVPCVHVARCLTYANHLLQLKMLELLQSHRLLPAAFVLQHRWIRDCPALEPVVAETSEGPPDECQCAAAAVLPAFPTKHCGYYGQL